MTDKIVLSINKTLKNLNPDELAKKAYPVFKFGTGNFRGTPIRTGNARRNTRLVGNTIEGQYPYAQRLDQGYSDQAPDGMTKPTLDFIQRYVEKYAKDK